MLKESQLCLCWKKKYLKTKNAMTTIIMKEKREKCQKKEVGITSVF